MTMCLPSLKGKLPVPESANAFFHIKSVLQGLQSVVKQTFDVNLTEVDLMPGKIQLHWISLFRVSLRRFEKMQGSAICLTIHM